MLKTKLESVPTVHLDPGRCKFIYCQVKLDSPDEKMYEFVRSKKGASLHHMVADALIDQLIDLGVPQERINIVCGGRCSFHNQKIQIYGYSNQYGQGDNEHIAKLVQKAYPDKDVEHSYEGY